MTALAIQKVSGLCPAGNLGEISRRLENGQTIDQSDFAGECDPAGLKELAALLPGISLRRMPRLAKIALGAALGAADSASPPEALIISTAYGSVTSTFEFLDSILQDGAEVASPTAFSHSVTNMTAAFVSQWLGITGPCLTITQPSLTAALETAAAMLASGQVASVLWGTISERSNIMEEVEKESGRQAFLLADGAVFFRLSLPDPNKKELRLEFGGDRTTCHPAPEFSADLAETLCPGPLALALRLALMSLSLEKDSTRSAARMITDGREALVINSGGVEA